MAQKDHKLQKSKSESKREENDHFRLEQVSSLWEVRLKLSQKRWSEMCREKVNQHSREGKQHEEA